MTVVETTPADRPGSAPPLVVRCGALGDTVLLTPLLDVLAARHGRPCDLLGTRFATDLFRDDPRVGTILRLDRRHLPYWFSAEKRRLVRALRSRGSGPVYLLDTAPGVRLLLERAGIDGERIVARDPGGRTAGIHVIEDNLGVAWKAGLLPEPAAAGPLPGTRLLLSAAARADGASWAASRGLDRAPYLVVQAGTSRTLRGKDPGRGKHWPEDRWLTLLGLLREKLPAANLLLAGAPREAAMTESIARGCGGGKVLSIAREMSVPRLAAVLEKAVACVSVDTGPAHMAAALGTPLVVLFGGTYPGRTAPVSCGSPVVIVSGPPLWPVAGTEAEWLACHRMDQITPPMVLEAVFSALPPGGPR